MARKSFIIALEEENLENVDPVETSNIPETSVEVERAQAEMNEEVVATEEDLEDIEQAEADISTVDEVTDVAEQTVEEGTGMDETSARLAEVAVESLYSMLGNKKRIVPAMEDFKMGRLAATKIAVENFKDTAIRIWQGIVAAFKNLFEKIKGFLAGLLRNAGMLVKHLESIKARAESTEFAGGELTGSIVAAISTEKKANAATALQILSNSEQLLESADKFTAKVNASVESCKAILSKPEVSEEEVKKELNGLKADAFIGIDIFKETSKDIVGEDKVSIGKDDATFYGPFANCNVLYIVAAAEGKDTAVDVGFEKAKNAVAEKGEAASKDDAIKVIDTAIALAKKLEQYKKVQSNIAKIVAAAQRASDVAISELKKHVGDNKENKTVYQETAATINVFNKLTAKFGTAIPKIVFDGAKVAGDYVVASMNVKKAEAAAK